jgi:hypothetical protein
MKNIFKGDENMEFLKGMFLSKLFGKSMLLGGLLFSLGHFLFKKRDVSLVK